MKRFLALLLALCAVALPAAAQTNPARTYIPVATLSTGTCNPVSDINIQVQVSGGSLLYKWCNPKSSKWTDGEPTTYVPNWIYVRDYGAVGDGVTDDRTAIQRALDAVPAEGGTVVFDSGKTYYVTGSVQVDSNTTLMGGGYNTVLTCPSAGWALSAPTNFGIININQGTNIRITNLRVRGTKVQTNINNIPKLIFMDRYNIVKVDRCWFENSNAEGIWQGCTGCTYPLSGTNIGLTIVDSEFFDIGYSNVTGFGDLTAIQAGTQYAIFANNRFNKVGTAIAGSGYHLVIANNSVRDVFGSGIGVGDSDPTGDVTITGNVIDIAESSTVRRGIYVGHNNSGRTDYPTNVVGNTIRVVGTGTGVIPRGIYIPDCQAANIASNIIEITGRGVGVEIETVSVVGGSSTISISNNLVRQVTETSTSYGFVSTLGVGTTLKLVSSNNRVYGQTRANSSYAYFYQTNSGTLEGSMSGDWKEEGFLRIGATTLTGAEYDKIPLFLQSNTGFPAIASAGFLRINSLGLGITGQPAYKIDTGLTTTDQARIGRTLTGSWTGIDGTYTFFQNAALSIASGNYAIAQDSGGETLVNSVTGKNLRFRINNVDSIVVDPSRNVSIAGPRLNLTEQASSPATPSSGNFSLYAKTDGKIYGKNDAGGEYDLTAGASGPSDWINVKTEYGATGDGTTNDTTAIQNALNAASTGPRRWVYMPQGTYLVTGLTMTGRVYIFGAGKGATIIKSATNAAILTTAADANALGGTISHLTIQGTVTAGSSQTCLNVTDATAIQGVVVDDVRIEDCGGFGLNTGKVFSSTFRDIKATNCAGYPINYDSGNQPSNVFYNIYAGTLRAGAVTGFRIRAGEFVCHGCNGIDNSIASSRWMSIGKKAGVDGDATNVPATAILYDSNIESFQAYGVYLYYNSNIEIHGRTFIISDGTAGAIGVYFELNGDGSAYFAQTMRRSFIGDDVDFAGGVAQFANNEPIHAPGFVPLEIQMGPQAAGGEPLATYRNTTTGSSQRLSRKDGRYKRLALTTSTTIPQPGSYYIEVDSTAGAVTVTLPWAGWSQNAQQPIVVKRIAGSNDVTFTASTGTVNGGSNYVLTSIGAGGVLIPDGNTGAGDYRVIADFNPSRITLTATTFANLGTPANGTFVFCSDCTIASPCAGGGTGALAKRLNSVWVCN